MEYLDKEVYTNNPTAAYFMQFNTTSRWRIYIATVKMPGLLTINFISLLAAMYWKANNNNLLFHNFTSLNCFFLTSKLKRIKTVSWYDHGVNTVKGVSFQIEYCVQFRPEHLTLINKQKLSFSNKTFENTLMIHHNFIIIPLQYWT